MGLEGLGGLESLEFRAERCPFSNSNSELELLFFREKGKGKSPYFIQTF